MYESAMRRRTVRCLFSQTFEGSGFAIPHLLHLILHASLAQRERSDFPLRDIVTFLSERSFKHLALNSCSSLLQLPVSLLHSSYAKAMSLIRFPPLLTLGNTFLITLVHRVARMKFLAHSKGQLRHQTPEWSFSPCRSRPSRYVLGSDRGASVPSVAAWRRPAAAP